MCEVLVNHVLRTKTPGVPALGFQYCIKELYETREESVPNAAGNPLSGNSCIHHLRFTAPAGQAKRGEK